MLDKHTHRFGDRLITAVVLSGFVLMFFMTGAFVGWTLRTSEDIYDELHQQIVADRAAREAARLTEQQILHDFGIAPPAPVASAPVGGQP